MQRLPVLFWIGLFGSLAKLLGYIAQLGKLANSSKTHLGATERLVLLPSEDHRLVAYGCVWFRLVLAWLAFGARPNLASFTQANRHLFGWSDCLSLAKFWCVWLSGFA